MYTEDLVSSKYNVQRACARAEVCTKLTSNI